MSPKLRPLMLPQLVEERRRRESSTTISPGAIVLAPSPSARATITPLTTTAATTAAAAAAAAATTASSTDLPPTAATRAMTPVSSHSSVEFEPTPASAPATPTFSQGHSRYASSTSSFELLGPYIPDYAPSPTVNCQKPGKRSLPDVQEEDPLAEDTPYDCLCRDGYCVHREDREIVASPLSAHSEDFVDQGFGPGSDCDGSSSPTYLGKKTRKGSIESPLSGIVRFRSRIPSLTRLKSTKRVNLPVSPVSDLSLDSYPLSCDPSRSRSSSVSACGRYQADRANEPPLPPTPALSFLDSNDSIGVPQPVDIERANAHASIETDRSMATTPLLPPLLTESTLAPVSQQHHKESMIPSVPGTCPTQQLQQQQTCPSSPTSPQTNYHVENPLTPVLPSPPLSSKPSLSDFKPLHASPEIPSIVQDAWSDRLGHANFSITPSPYQPEQQSIESLRQLRIDWDAARMAYGRHIARIGEHYGHTSKTYNLTEAKWRETQLEWQLIHDALVDQIADTANVDDRTLERVPVTVPKLQAMGNKFPTRGDEDIVGPMMRAVTMLPAHGGGEDKKAARFWRILAERVGLKR